jgi:hypothetical protein
MLFCRGKHGIKAAYYLFSQDEEPRIIFYNAYINEDGTQLTVLQAHPDSASVEVHIEVTEPTFTKMGSASFCQASIYLN